MALALTLRSLEMATELAQAHNLPHDMRSTDARDLMRSLRFDQAPVMRLEDQEPNEAVGYGASVPASRMIRVVSAFTSASDQSG